MHLYQFIWFKFIFYDPLQFLEHGFFHLNEEIGKTSFLLTYSILRSQIIQKQKCYSRTQ